MDALRWWLKTIYYVFGTRSAMALADLIFPGLAGKIDGVI
jgi:hypothetical protein